MEAVSKQPVRCHRKTEDERASQNLIQQVETIIARQVSRQTVNGIRAKNVAHKVRQYTARPDFNPKRRTQCVGFLHCVEETHRAADLLREQFLEVGVGCDFVSGGRGNNPPG
jgi:hypothetical protein